MTCEAETEFSAIGRVSAPRISDSSKLRILNAIWVPAAVASCNFSPGK